MVFLMTVSMDQTQTPQAVSPASCVARGHDWYKKGELDRAMAGLNIGLAHSKVLAVFERSEG